MAAHHISTRLRTASLRVLDNEPTDYAKHSWILPRLGLCQRSGALMENTVAWVLNLILWLALTRSRLAAMGHETDSVDS